MKILNELEQAHQSVKDGLIYKKCYQRLTAKKSRDSWQRIVDAIEGILKNHRIDDELFKEFYDQLKEEVKHIERNGQGAVPGFTLVYAMKIANWWGELSCKVHYTHYLKIKLDPNDYEKFVEILTNQYKEYEKQQIGFFENVEVRKKSIVEVQAKQLESFNKKAQKQESTNPDQPSLTRLPQEILLQILKFASVKDIARLEVVNSFIKKLIITNPIWRNFLTLQINTNGVFKSKFFTRYPEYKGKDLNTIEAPKDKYHQVIHELKVDEENKRLREQTYARGDYEYYDRKGRFFSVS